jgi:hypothetical protein
MMDDHFTLSAARNALVDALQALLKADIMTAEDFRAARYHADLALREIEDLLARPAPRRSAESPDLFAPR